jgi:hypothetical protein
MTSDEDSPTSTLRRRYLTCHPISGIWILAGIGSVIGLVGLIGGPGYMSTILSLVLLFGAPGVTGGITWLLWQSTRHKTDDQLNEFIVRRGGEIRETGKLCLPALPNRERIPSRSSLCFLLALFSARPAIGRTSAVARLVTRSSCFLKLIPLTTHH